MTEYQVFGPICVYTHILAFTIPFAVALALRIFLGLKLRAARRRAEYRRNWNRRTQS